MAFTIRGQISGDAQEFIWLPDRRNLQAASERIVPAGELCEVELDDGLVITLKTDELASSPWFELGQERDDSLTPVLRLASAELADTRSAERGLGNWIKQIKFKIVSNLSPNTWALSAIEQILCPHPGFFSIASDLTLKPAQVKANDAAALVFLHGTFSGIASAFAGLFGHSEIRNKLYQRYGEEVYGLQHRTLEQSPIDNAIALLRALPKGKVIDVIAHSRGGLIAELLCQQLAPNSESQLLAQLQDSEVDAEQHELWRAICEGYQELLALKRQKNIVVRRFVRVATPALGTTLASKERARLVFALWRKALKNQDSSIVAEVTAGLSRLLESIALDVIKPHQVPGLFCMDPKRPVITKLINHPDFSSDSELVVIGANTEVLTGPSKSADLAIDLFFGRANDWVVDTDAMLGGAKRTGPVYQYRPNSVVNHVGYFSDPHFAKLIGDSVLLPWAELAKRTVLQAAVTSRAGPGQLSAGIETRELTNIGNKNGPLLYLLPGIMGSHLNKGNNRIWLDVLSYFTGGFAKLRIDQDHVRAVALVGDAYQSMIDAFVISHEVIAFPYDWRQSLHSAGQALNASLRQQLSSIDIGKRPIQIIAHSMGGMVVRAMLALPDSAWRQALVHPQSRIIMLGTPNLGSHAITQILTGQEDLVKKIATVDLTNSLASIVEFAARFPGGLDLMPDASAEDQRDYFAHQTWQELMAVKGAKWPLVKAEDLLAAKQWRQSISGQDLNAARVYYIAGQAHETPVGIRAKKPQEPIAFMQSPRGDGRVPWDTGIPKHLPTWYAAAVQHGDLPGNKQVQRACKDILATGDSKALSKQEPAALKQSLFARLFAWLRDGQASDELNDISRMPNAKELEAAALGGSVFALKDELQEQLVDLPMLNVSVTWGHLHDARHPIFVGHYQGDSICGAEAAIDKRLDQRLSEHLALGQYPGEVGSFLSIIRGNQRGLHVAATVLGLGEIGSLNTSKLTKAVYEALLGYAERLQDHLSFKPGQQRGLDLTGLSFLMIGSSMGGVSIAECGRVMLQAVHEARLQLRARSSALANLQHVEFIELYHDRAHQLWYALDALLSTNQDQSSVAELASSDNLAPYFRLQEQINIARDGRRRLRIGDYDGWWQPLKIEKRERWIWFENLASRARADVQTLQVDPVVQSLIKSSIQGSQRDLEVEQALFELLIPLELKNQSQESADLRLLLNPGAAAYPWEMLTDRMPMGRQRSALPQSVRLGMVRQLSTSNYRKQINYAKGNNAYVVWDPVSPLPELPGAQREGKQVASFLDLLGWNVKVSPRESAGDVIRKQFGAGHALLHYAGHGVDDIRRFAGGFANPIEVNPDAADQGNSAISGMVLGDGLFLTYDLIDRIREVPQLVFINCCHLGAIDARNNAKPHESAANFAEKFLQIGVRAVIAAGWAVHDLAAAIFATTFYQQFLGQGATFGEAVRRARRATFEQFPNSNTYAAYQCYGDPGFKWMSASTASVASQSKAWRIPSADACIAEELPNLGSVEQLDALLEHVKATPHLNIPRVLAAFAQHYERANAMQRAADLALTALLRSEQTPDAAGIDQFSRFIYLRGRLILRSPDAVNDKTKQLEKLLDYVQGVNAVLPTSERDALAGGVLRRLAMVSTDAARTKALQRALVCYQNAEEKLAEITATAFQRFDAALRLAITHTALGYALVDSTATPAKPGKVRKLEAAPQFDHFAQAQPYLKRCDELLIDIDKQPERHSSWGYFAQEWLTIAQAFASGKIDSKWTGMVDNLLDKLLIAKDADFKSSIIEQLQFLLACGGASQPKLAKALTDLWQNLEQFQLE